MYSALQLFSQIDVEIGQGPDQIDIPSTDLSQGSVEIILTIVFGVFAAICVLVIVVAGLLFVLGRGNPDQSARARNAIIYAFVGLAVSVLASAIIRFVVGRV